MSRYIDADVLIEELKRADASPTVDASMSWGLVTAGRIIDHCPTAEVVEVGKPYPREELEKYGLSEWIDEEGLRWVMVERREHE